MASTDGEERGRWREQHEDRRGRWRGGGWRRPERCEGKRESGGEARGRGRAASEVRGRAKGDGGEAERERGVE